jgi:hypothetical protein
MSDLAPGIYKDMAAKDYFADPCPLPSLSQSIAKIVLAKSPLHAWHAHPRLNPEWMPDEHKYEKVRAIGNAAHSMVLGRGKELTVVRVPRRVKEKNKWIVPDPAHLIDADDMTTDAAQRERDCIAAAGAVPILGKHADVALRIMAAARAQIDRAGCPEAFRDGDGEVVILAYDEEYGIWLRSMVDWMCATTLIYDLKTGETSAAPQDIPRRIVNDGWAIQAAMQERILDILDPENRGQRAFRFVAIEDDVPYALTVNEISPWSGVHDEVSGEALETALEIGRRQVRKACEIWGHCMRTNQWPAYPPLVHEPRYPAYASAQWLNREIHEAGQARLPGKAWPDQRNNRFYREKNWKPEPFDPNVVNAG